MKTAMVLFAGAMFTSLAAGTFDSQLSEDRHRAKYGRNTPAYESRLDSPAPMQQAAACCRSHRRGSLAAASTDQRFVAKYGRSTPAAETALAMHVRQCNDLGKCNLMPAKAAVSTASAVSDSDARSRAKYGRAFPAQAPQDVVLVAMGDTPCEHACCRRGQ